MASGPRVPTDTPSRWPLRSRAKRLGVECAREHLAGNRRAIPLDVVSQSLDADGDDERGVVSRREADEERVDVAVLDLGGSGLAGDGDAGDLRPGARAVVDDADQGVDSVVRGAEPVYTEPSHPTQIYEALIYLLVFGITMYMYWKTNAKDRQGLILGVDIALIFIARFFIEFVKNVQVDSEIAMRENTGLILGQWLSIPFIIWGFWLIWRSMKRKAELPVQKEKINADYSQNVKPKK